MSPYLFPPFSLVGKVVNKILADEVEQAILVFPFWKSQAWFPLILSNVSAFPVRLPRHRDLLVLAHNGQLYPLQLSMVAVQLSGNCCKVKDFQKVLKQSSFRHGDPVHVSSTVWP